jgi:UDP-glucose 4-epimerase
VKNIVVTGGSGFIGSHVVDNLISKNFNVIVADQRLERFSKRDDVDYTYMDIRDQVQVTECFARADGFIHLAGVLGTQETIMNPAPAAHTNILGGLNIFEAANQYDLSGVYIAVGNHWMNNTYSISKTATERFADMFNKERNGKIAIVRALNAYGPYQKPAHPWGSSKVRKIIPNFIMPALKNETITIYGDGNQIMDMIFVEDVAEILVQALINENTKYDKIYEAGSGNKTTVNDIAKLVIDIVGQGNIEYVPMRPGEPENSIVIGDPSTFSEIHTNELTPLEEGLKITVDYFRNNYL